MPPTIASDDYHVYYRRGICGLGDAFSIITDVKYSDGSHVSEYFLKVLGGRIPFFRHCRYRANAQTASYANLVEISLDQCNALLHSYQLDHYDQTKINRVWEHDYSLLSVDISKLYAVFVNDRLGSLATSLAKKTVSKKLADISNKLLRHVGKIQIEDNWIE